MQAHRSVWRGKNQGGLTSDTAARTAFHRRGAFRSLVSILVVEPALGVEPALPEIPPNAYEDSTETTQKPLTLGDGKMLHAPPTINFYRDLAGQDRQIGLFFPVRQLETDG